MLYITHSQLMRESEHAVVAHTTADDDSIRRVCLQLLADDKRYSLWHAHHDQQMDDVASARRRNAQILQLRMVALKQIHRAALVRYLRDNHVAGAARDFVLSEFHGVADTRDAALAEHRSYLLATSTQICTSDILDLAGDTRGGDLLGRYELLYQQFFSMFCDRSRALRDGEPYLLEMLLPETRDAAKRLRLRILDSNLAPVRPIFVGAAPRGKERTPPGPREERRKAKEGTPLLDRRRLWR